MAALPSLTTVSPGNRPAGDALSLSDAVPVGAELLSFDEGSVNGSGGSVVGASETWAAFRGSMDLSTLLTAGEAALCSFLWNVCLSEQVREWWRLQETMRRDSLTDCTSIRRQPGKRTHGKAVKYQKQGQLKSHEWCIHLSRQQIKSHK